MSDWDFKLEASALSGVAEWTPEFRLARGVVPWPLAVVAFRASEAMNELGQVEVLAHVPHGLVAETIEPGDELRLVLEHPLGTRVLAGIVVAKVTVASDTERGLRLLLRPRAFRLTKRRDTRIFQGKSVVDVVRVVLEAHGVEHELRLRERYEPREYVTQYEESDFDFVQRLLASEGIAFWFEHPLHALDPRPERMVLADSTSALTPLLTPPLLFRPGLARSQGQEGAVRSLEKLEQVEAQVLTSRAYDFERMAPTPGHQRGTPEPGATPVLEGGTSSGVHASRGRAERDLESYEPSLVRDAGATVAAVLSRRLEQVRRGAEKVKGTTQSRSLAVGGVLAILDHDLDIPLFAVTELEHEGRAGEEPYGATFYATRATELERPSRPRRRFVQTAEPAIVTGPEGQEIHTDGLGRVKLHFTWDRQGRSDESSSCWVRVMQPWSGPGYGFQFVPRVGTEVLVTFVGGDPDHPVVMGCLPNPTVSLPFDTGNNPARSGLRTRSSPKSEGHNELAFEDEAGAELLLVRAQRDHEVVVLRQHTVRVGGEQQVHVAEDRVSRVAGDDQLEIRGNQVTRVEGGSTTTTAGAVVTRVKGVVDHEVTGDVGERLDGNRLTVVGGDARLLVGTKRAGSFIVQASGAARVVGKEGIRLYSPTELELRCGDTSLVLRPDELVIKAKTVRVEVEELAKVEHESGASLEVTKELSLSGEAVKLLANAASLALTADVELKGAQIKLAGAGSANRAARSSEDAAKGKAKFKFDLPEGHSGPFSALVMLPTGETQACSVSSSGELELEGFDGEEFQLVEFRAGDDRWPFSPVVG